MVSYGNHHLSARHRQDPPGAFQEDVGREDTQFQAGQALSFQQIPYGYGSIPIHTIFSGMNIHLPAILMFTRGTRF